MEVICLPEVKIIANFGRRNKIFRSKKQRIVENFAKKIRNQYSELIGRSTVALVTWPKGQRPLTPSQCLVFAAIVRELFPEHYSSIGGPLPTAIEIQWGTAEVLGIIEMARSNFHEAETWFRQLTELNTKYAPGYLALGRALMAQGKVQEAGKFFKRADVKGHASGELRMVKQWEEAGR